MATHHTKRLVICCDGTWDNSDSGFVKDGPFDNGHLQSPSNVTRIGRAILPEDGQGVQQIVYYQAGVGSGSISFSDHLYAGVTGRGLSENIREAYSFLVNNYEDASGQPDDVFLLGFSRGAFTARSIAGMIGAIGLLTKRGMDHFYEIFSDFENAGSKQAYTPKLPKKLPSFRLPAAVEASNIAAYLPAYMQALKDARLTREVRITAIGVWDTVGALGVPIIPAFQRIFGKTAFQEYQFYDTSIDDHIDNAFHALALDEARSTFVPAVWERPYGCNTKATQVWFAGAHSDVGGGYGSLDTSAQDISLAWMMSKLDAWIAFDPDYLRSEVQKQKDAGAIQRRWGCGQIHNSGGGFWRLGGSTTRTPSQYHRTNYDTGMYTKEKLQDTMESVHASVRIRQLYGTGPAGESTYNTPFTKEWRHQNDKWVYIGTSEDGRGCVMAEDGLGVFERQLLSLVDAQMEEEVFEH